MQDAAGQQGRRTLSVVHSCIDGTRAPCADRLYAERRWSLPSPPDKHIHDAVRHERAKER